MAAILNAMIEALGDNFGSLTYWPTNAPDKRYVAKAPSGATFYGNTPELAVTHIYDALRLAPSEAAERKRVQRVAESSRAFLQIYDEFDGDPSCVGEYLDALCEAIDALGD